MTPDAWEPRAQVPKGPRAGDTQSLGHRRGEQAHEMGVGSWGNGPGPRCGSEGGGGSGRECDPEGM